ncbi:hypothetical protein E2542_SST10905 [Spatholobus suberectus]|nr:hypothetical protein E2542_SST10905 [Spatholobus suberectus]
MTRSYKKLQAKLQELQSVLDEALLLGSETQSHDSISNDIKQKFAFIGNLLSAEVASHPSKPHHLHHISERLSTLEREFHQWDSFRTLSFNDSDKDSTCSCTESCLNDDGEARDGTDSVAFEEPEKIFPDSNCEKAMVEYGGAVSEATGYVEEKKQTGEIKNGFDKLASFDYEDAEDFFEDFAGDMELVEFDGALLSKTEEEGKKDNDLEREQRRDNTFGKECCALAAGIVIGMILMAFIMVNISGCFHYVEEVSFAVPT